MTRHTQWNRRTFLRRLGYVSGLGVVGARTTFSLWPNSKTAKDINGVGGEIRPSFAYVGSFKHGIEVFAVEKYGWKPVQSVLCDRPSCLVFHPNGKYLYATNEVDEYQGLPAGTVEAYSIDANNGELTLLNRQALSLSARTPKHLAISPDGSRIVVAVHGGGSYNVLPVRTDGSLDRVSGILKQVGCGLDLERRRTSHPQMVLFDSGQRAISADSGNDSVNVFTVENDRLVVAHRRNTLPGSGPCSIALHPSERFLILLNQLDLSISCFGYDAENGTILDQLHHRPFHSPAPSATDVTPTMAMHQSGNFLYTYGAFASGFRRKKIATWSIDPTNGTLDLIQNSAMSLSSSGAASLVVEPDALFVLSERDGIFRMNLDAGNGLLGNAVQVAKVSAPRSMLLKYAEEI